MATYYGTYGQKVQYLASDPSDPQIGQVWYNFTSATLKVRQEVATNSWASGGALNTGRGAGIGGAGTQTAALAFGGRTADPFSTPGNYTGATEKYNGTSWTTTGSLNTTRQGLGGAGSQTAALAFGGNNPAVTSSTELFNGSTWTSNPTGLNTARFGLAAAGNQTAALGFGGANPPGNTATNVTELWNGTSWTISPATLGTSRYWIAGSGTQTAALAFGGYTGTASNATESYNGSTWTSVNALNTARWGLGGAGTQTAIVAFGGLIPPTTGATELWNGTSWTSNPTGLGTARYYFSGTGTQTSALAAGGSPGFVTTTEEWSGIVAQNRTVTVS